MMMHWSQALMETSHAASIPNWIHWPESLITLFVALIVSCLCLRYRYWEKGLPFRSRQATKRAVTVIIATSVLATVVSVVLTTQAIVSVGVAIPVLLCADRLKRELKRDGELSFPEQPQWYSMVASIGVIILLGKLEIQMSGDREKWSSDKMKQEVNTLGDLTTAAEHVRSTLTRRTSSEHLKTALQADHDQVLEAVANAWEARAMSEPAKVRHQAHVARQALISMLGRAYDWGYTDIEVMPPKELDV